MLIEDRSGRILSKVLDLTAQRHKVLAHNLSNMNTPGYKRLEYNFDAALAEAVQDADKGLNGIEVQVTEDPTAVARADGNSVQMEREIAELSKNALLYQTMIQFMGRRAQVLRLAITGRS